MSEKKWEVSKELKAKIKPTENGIF